MLHVKLHVNMYATIRITQLVKLINSPFVKLAIR